MIRKIIEIDRKKCNGCGACVNACHEGAIGMTDGKAVLLRDDYCDGLGDCLPACPTGAISFVKREALEYDKEAVMARMKKKEGANMGCPGSRAAFIKKSDSHELNSETIPSRLMQWPVQIKLVPVSAPYFNCADLLIAADCTAFAYGNFHNDFIKDKITLIGCPKLDAADYSEKLGEIIASNDIKSVTVVRMEVPCCGGIEYAAQKAIEKSGKNLALKVVTINHANPENTVERKIL
ncbi:MAG: 4Fe-4S binding protein [Clostridia bacterium]|nr:4Fe-4S binding protein [Clostridia bacterium]